MKGESVFKWIDNNINDKKYKIINQVKQSKQT